MGRGWTRWKVGRMQWGKRRRLPYFGSAYLGSWNRTCTVRVHQLTQTKTPVIELYSTVTIPSFR